jgi:hypothetical protein
MGKHKMDKGKMIKPKFNRPDCDLVIRMICAKRKVKNTKAMPKAGSTW